MSQVKKTGPQFTQGQGGGGKTKSNGSHMTPAGDVSKRGKSGDHMTPHNITTTPSGSHLEPNVAGTQSSSVRGGGTIFGNDPNKVGSKSSGSKNAQNPNVRR